MGQTVNLLAYAFGGSNPSLPTKNIGALVQPVRMPACHAGGHGFESRTHRDSPANLSFTGLLLF